MVKCAFCRKPLGSNYNKMSVNIASYKICNHCTFLVKILSEENNRGKKSPLHDILNFVNYYKHIKFTKVK